MASSRRLFFLATDTNTPSGGRMVVYQLVDILVKNGYNAYALHQKRGFRYTWFPNNTPVCCSYQIKRERIRYGGAKELFRYGFDLLKDIVSCPFSAEPSVQLSENDVLVLSGREAAYCREILVGVPKISLSQNPFIFFQANSLDCKTSIEHRDIIGRITMSKLNYEMHCNVFSEDAVWNVPVYIDVRYFSYSHQKKKQIAFMPRRLQGDSRALINMLNLRGNLSGFSFVPIDNKTLSETAKIMKESLIFLSFSHREGLGLPPAEAMACGCIVIGYSGNGGDEFFHEDIAFKIADGDVLHYVEIVEQVTQEHITNPLRLDTMRKKASVQILQTYSRENMEKYLLESWSEIMSRCESK